MAGHIAQIRADIDNPDVYLVFADWLQERGDPWGELIVLAHALEERKGDSAIAAKLENLCKQHGWNSKAKADTLRVEWRWGFIRSIHYYDLHASHQVKDIIAVAESVMKLPMASLVDEYLVFRYDPHGALPFPGKGTVVSPSYTETGSMPLNKDAAWIWTEEMSGNISQYKNLRCLNVSSDCEIHKAIAEVPLERLDFNYQELPEEVWGIETLGHIDGLPLSNARNWSQVNVLLSGFLRARTPSKQRIFESALFLGKRPEATIEQLLLALDNNLKVVRVQAHSVLSQVLENPLNVHPIGKGSVLSVIGSLNIDKKVLKNRVESAGAILVTKLGAKTTHVLIGLRPNGRQHEIGALPLLVEEHLAGLIRAAPSIAIPIAKLSTMLRSKKDASICEAVQHLQEQGGVPSALLPELFCVVQDTHLSSLGKGRELAGKLFSAYAPKLLRQSVAQHMKTSVLLAGEFKVAYRLAALERSAGKELDFERVARIFYEDHSTATKFILERDNPEEIAWVLQSRIRDRRLDLQEVSLATLPDLSAYNLLEIDLGNNRLWNLPGTLLQLDNVEVLSLRKNDLVQIPSGISGMRSLKKLDLSDNPRLRVLPDEVWALENLQVLLLSGCDSLHFNKRHVKSLLSGFAKRNADREQRVFEGSLLQSLIPRGTQRLCLEALDSNVESVQSLALYVLAKHVENPLDTFPVDSQSVVAIVGKVEGKEALLKRFKAMGANVTGPRAKEPTHILLGVQPKGRQFQLGDAHLLLEVHVLG